MFDLRQFIFRQKKEEKTSLIKVLMSNPDKFKYEIEVIDEKIVVTMTKKDSE